MIYGRPVEIDCAYIPSGIQCGIFSPTVEEQIGVLRFYASKSTFINFNGVKIYKRDFFTIKASLYAHASPTDLYRLGVQTGVHKSWERVSAMTEKNAKKQKAKAMRNVWTCARPVTQIVPNKKAYNRKREKDSINKGRKDI